MLNPTPDISLAYPLGSAAVLGLVVIPHIAVAFVILRTHCSSEVPTELVSFRWRERRAATDWCPMCRSPMGALRTVYITAECMICLEEVDTILISECGHCICKQCSPRFAQDSAPNTPQAHATSSEKRSHSSKGGLQHKDKVRISDMKSPRDSDKWGPPLTWCGLFRITKQGSWHAGTAEAAAELQFNTLRQVWPVNGTPVTTLIVVVVRHWQNSSKNTCCATLC